jgi:hypothetical protein
VGMFLLWCAVACVGASLALAGVAWACRCRCPACEPVRWRLTRPALDGAHILHRSSIAAKHDLRFLPYGMPFVDSAANRPNQPDPIDWGVMSDPKVLDALNNNPLVQYGKARREWIDGGCVGPAPVPPRNVGLYTQEFGRGKRKP